MAIPVQFDEALLETVAAPDLPADWTEEPPPPSSMEIGDRWVKDARSVAPGTAKRDHSNRAELPAQSRASTLQEGHPWQTRALLLRSTVALIPPDLGLPWLPHLSPTGNPTQRPLTARSPALISSPTAHRPSSFARPPGSIGMRGFQQGRQAGGVARFRAGTE